MSNTRNTPSIHYRYDALDRLASHVELNKPECQRFYCDSRLVTEMEGGSDCRLFSTAINCWRNNSVRAAASLARYSLPICSALSLVRFKRRYRKAPPTRPTDIAPPQEACPAYWVSMVNDWTM